MKSDINVELIRAYIKENKMSKSEFVKECGIALSSLNLVLQEDSNIGLGVVLKIARHMKKELKDMFLK